MPPYQRVEALFHRVYAGHPGAATAFDRLRGVIDQRRLERPLDLQHRDQMQSRDWYLSSRQIGYSCYVDRFAGRLANIRLRIPHLRRLGVTYLHLLPIFDTAGDPNDGGFAVADYRAVDAKLGDLDDLRALCTELHANGIALCVDFIANHTSSRHPWAKRAVRGDPDYRDFYHFFERRDRVQSAEAALRSVFPKSAPGNFLAIPDQNAWVWSTFQDYQWDLNYANPWVLVEMVDNLLFIINQGVDALRVDSAPFLWKEVGTPSMGRPEAHLLLQIYRAALDAVAPSTALLAEAIVPPAELIEYLGHPSAIAQECQIAYHGVVMPIMWLSLVSQDARPLTRVLRGWATPPAGTTWLQYVRSHDNIEWDVLTDDLLSLAGLTAEDTAESVRFLHGQHEDSFARGEPFEATATSRLSTNGTTASLCGLQTGRQGSSLALDRVALLYGVLYALPGFPMIFSGDEIGMANDAGYRSRPHERDDSRWLHRPAFDWARMNADAASVPGRLMNAFEQLATARQTTGDFGPAQPIVLPDDAPPSLFVMNRIDNNGRRLTIVANFADHALHLTPTLVADFDLAGPRTDLISGRSEHGALTNVAAYSVAWLLWA